MSNCLVKNEIKVTIGIPMYNARKTLFKTLCSINNQTVMPDEILIVDDCSTDEIDDILNKFDNLPIKVIKLDTNQGSGVVRQNILDNCNNDYLIYLDADDVLCDVFLIQNVKAYGQNNPIVIIPNFYEQLDGNKIYPHVNEETIAWCHGKAYNVKYLKDNNISFPTLRTHEDVAFNAIVFSSDDKNIIYTNTFSYLWNYHDNTITRKEDYVFNKYTEYIDALEYAYNCTSKIFGKWKANKQLFESAIIGFLYVKSFELTRDNEEMINKNKLRYLNLLKNTKIWKMFFDETFLKSIEMHKQNNLITIYNTITNKVCLHPNTMFIPRVTIWDYIEENKDFLERSDE